MSLNLGVLSAAVTLSDTQYVNTLDNLEQKSDNTFKKIGDAAKNYLSTNALVSFAKDSVAAFRVQETAVESVRATLRNLGKETELATSRMSDFASEMQKISTYGDEATLAAMAQGMRLGIDPADIENVTKAAMGLAAKIGTDLPTAMMLLARANKGQTQMLSRYGITLDQTKSKEEQYQEILRAGTDSFSLVIDAANTATGKMTQFANALGDTKEVFGEQWQKALTDVIAPLTGLITEFNNADQATKKLVVTAASLTAGLVLLSNFGLLKAGNAALFAAAGFVTSGTSAGIASFGVKGLTAAVHGLNAALGPLGWAIIAISAIYAGITYVQEKAKKSTEELSRKSKEELEIEEKKIAVQKKSNDQKKESIKRLKELAKYNKLSSSAKTEAATIIQNLQAAYGNLDISLDETTGKIIVQEGAFERLAQAQRMANIEIEEKRIAALEKSLKEQADIAVKEIMPTGKSLGLAGDKYIAEKIKSIIESKHRTDLEKIADFEKLIKHAKEEYDEDDSEMKRLQDVLNMLKKVEEAKKNARNLKTGGSAANDEKELKVITEAQQQALKELSETEWDIAFDMAIPEKKIQMIQDKIDGIFEEYKNANKYVSINDFLSANTEKMTEQELKDRKKLVELIAQEDKLISHTADEMERKRDIQEKELADARRRKTDVEEQHQEFMSEQAAYQIEVKLKNLEKTGDKAQYDKLIQQEFTKAAKAAAEAEQAYMAAYNQIQKQGTVDKDAESQLRKLLKAAQDAQNKQRSWEDKIKGADENPDIQQENVRKVVGSWSLAEFSRQQENSVESRIEKNTRETARILRNNKGYVY